MTDGQAVPRYKLRVRYRYGFQHRARLLRKSGSGKRLEQGHQTSIAQFVAPERGLSGVASKKAMSSKRRRSTSLILTGSSIKSGGRSEVIDAPGANRCIHATASTSELHTLLNSFGVTAAAISSVKPFY
jgi:hypothetical protein